MLLIYSFVFKIKYNLTSCFFLIASVSFLGMIFTFSSALGTRDWDICIVAAVAYNVSNAHFLLMLYEQKWCKNIKYGIVMIAGFSICHTSMWLLTNRTDASIQWVEKAYSTDPFLNKNLRNELLLAAIFDAAELYDKSLQWSQKDYQMHRDDPKTAQNYASALQNHGRDEEAWAVMEQNIKGSPRYVPAYHPLINHYLTIQNYDALYSILVQMESIYKQYPEEFISRLPQEQIDWYLGILAELREMRAAGQ
ncbi:hypothetical protein AGMMS4957_07530 [Bacteroidia bacterium]|nr:hypothetical protein AGMMS4957_07530 [Bacteroidia bacterium]